MRQLSLGLLPFLTLILLAFAAKAIVSGSFVVSGQITKPDGSPLESSSVNFTVEISDPGAGTCVLWSESFANTDMTASAGNFSLNLGSGTRNDTGATLNQVFSNQNTLSGSLCGGTYTPVAGDERKIKISFSDSGGATQTLSSQLIKAVPTAATVGGYGSANLAKISGVGSSNTFTPSGFDFLYNISAPGLSNATPCTDGQVLQYQGTAWHCAAVGSYGPVTFATTPQWSGAPSGANDLVNKTYVDAQVAAGLPNFGTAGTYAKVTTDAKGRVSSGTTLTATDIPSLDAAKITSGIIPTSQGGTGSSAALTGGKVIVSTGTVMTEGMSWSTAKSPNTFVTRDAAGNIFGAFGSFDGAALNAGGALSIYGATSGLVGLVAPNSVTSYNFVLPISAGSGGQVLTTNGTGITSWSTPAAADNLGNHTATMDLNLGSFNATNALGYYLTGYGKLADSSGYAFMKAWDASGIAAQAVSSAGHGVIYFDSAANKFKGSQNGSAYSNILFDVPSSVSDSNIALITTPGKIAMTSPAAGSGISIAGVNSGAVGISLGTVSGGGSKGISISGVAGTGSTGLAVSGVTNGTGISVASSATANALDVSNTTGAAINVSSGLTSVQNLQSTKVTVSQIYTATSGNMTSSNSQIIANPSSSTTGNYYASSSIAQLTGTNGSSGGVLGAISASSSHGGSGSLFAVDGVESSVINSSVGSIGSAIGLYGEVANTSTGSISNAFGGYFQISNSVGTVSTGIGLYVGAVSASTKWSIYAADATAPSYFAGKVGVGNTNPSAKLQVNGAIVSTERTGSSGIADFSTGNTIVFSSVGGSVINLQNMVAGGSYKVIIEDPQVTTYSFSGCTPKFATANGTTTASTTTIYNIYYRSPGICYIDWRTGYQ